MGEPHDDADEMIQMPVVQRTHTSVQDDDDDDDAAAYEHGHGLDADCSMG